MTGVKTCRLFTVLYLPWLSINMVSVINVLPFTRVVLLLFAVWALWIGARTYFTRGLHPWRHKYMPFLLAFLAACLLSQLLQFADGGFDMLGKLCYFAICLVIVYAQYGTDTVGYVSLLRDVARTLGVVLGVLFSISDWMFTVLFRGTVIGRNGATIPVGFAQNRLFGLFSSPNVGGLCALILLWCTFLTFRHAGRRGIGWRVIAVLEALAAVVYISVALSRGTYVSGVVLIVSFLLIRPPLTVEERLRVVWQWCIRVGSAVLAVFVCMVGLYAVNKAACTVMVWNYEQKLEYSSEEEADELAAIVENALQGSAGRVEADRDDIDITNKRTGIWRAHLQLLEGVHRLIGVNHPLIFTERRLQAGKTFWVEQVNFIRHANGNLHNGYLQILVNGGLLALIPMLLFLTICGVRSARRLIAPTRTAAYELFAVTLPPVLAILCNNIFETNFVLMGANFMQAFFWLVAGACVQTMTEKEGRA